MLRPLRPVSILLLRSRKRPRPPLGPIIGLTLLFTLTILLHLSSRRTEIIQPFPLRKPPTGNIQSPYPNANEHAPTIYAEVLPSSATAPTPPSDATNTSSAPSSESSITANPPPLNTTHSNDTKTPTEPEAELDFDLPPDYKDVRKWQQELPQHNLSLPYPEGKDGRYVKFSCGIQMLGWNNVLNEMYA